MRPELTSDEMRPFVEQAQRDAMAGGLVVSDFDDYVDSLFGVAPEAYRLHATAKVAELMAAVADQQAAATEILTSGWPELREGLLAWLGVRRGGG